MHNARVSGVRAAELSTAVRLVFAVRRTHELRMVLPFSSANSAVLYRVLRVIFSLPGEPSAVHLVATVLVGPLF